MSNAARNEVLSSFGETINNSLAEMDRQKASKTPFNDRAQKRLDMRSKTQVLFPPFDFQNGGRRIKI